MKSENLSTGNTLVDNELDIRGLVCTLWRGKPWIIAIAVLFSVTALLYSYLVKQEWSATAITDKPTVNMLGGYYSQQQFLRNLDAKSFAVPQSEQPSISADVYDEFIMQLAAYDTRRDFWLQTDYYKQRQEGDVKADAALLDELVNNIQFTPRDDAKKTSDTVKLMAETPADANTLLRQYVVFASQHAAGHLNEEITGAWAARTIFIKSQIKRQEAVARAIYEREIRSVEQALKIAQQQGISRSQTDTPADELPASEMFLLGRPMLQARLESLQASGPHYDLDYDQNRAMLTTLNVGPTLDASFQTYRYLRTPEEPVKRDSPRRAFLMVMWGAIGALVGAGFALVRRPRQPAR
ncbi:ECA polysaccharide chain length modulation protein [Brenneria roseae subsp. americana]|uniref:ECA polysaccharide chain length modulation protein n=1 Tax=Brenneria roseae subsp. americana TaxID=1508507 RepID=A0A2U1TR03_9GAMM|nr:ECA polysaccharide chain length modulation protein [Brenneria roseae]PWC11802.1 ECA polysaccharide chain length modulation protein [Brenneria roseae subsp. americana]